MSSQHEMQASNRGPVGDGAGQRSLAGPQVGEGTAQARQPRPLIAALAVAGTGIAILVVIPLHSLLALPADAPLHPWWGLFNWSALTLWLTCTVVLARRLLQVASVRSPDAGRSGGASDLDWDAQRPGGGG